MDRRHFLSGKVAHFLVGGLLLISIIGQSVLNVSASRQGIPQNSLLMDPLSPTPTFTPTASPGYFYNPYGPSCVGSGCSSPTGYNVVVNATRNEQSLHAYDPSWKYWTGGGRVETKVHVSGAGIGPVRLYYAYNGANCNNGYAISVFKFSGNVNYPDLPSSGYFDVILASKDGGAFGFYTRCLSGGAYMGEYGIDSLWYSFVQPVTPTPTATMTNTPTLIPTNTPTAVSTSTPLCYGDTCNGLFPSAMGCGEDAQTYPNYKLLYDVNNNLIGVVENRYSVACLAQWERTRNTSGASLYAEGSIRWGGEVYSSGYNFVDGYTSSIDGWYVYTAMYAINAGIGPSLNCGELSTAPITAPSQPLNLNSHYVQYNCFAR